jgi:endonuclease/exonuclease/phosphatase family metal-dependent hydrolase
MDTRRIALWAGFFTLLACDPPNGPALPSRSAEPTASAPFVHRERDLAIASFNVLYENATNGPSGPEVEPETVRTIARLADADVILFQETNALFESAIRDVLGSTHSHCAFHPPVRYLPGGLGFCTRAPIRIEAEEILESPVGWFPAQRIVLDWNHERIQIINVHLRPAIGSRDDWWRANEATRADRKTEMAFYLSKLDRDTAAFVVGDFNDPNRAGVFDVLGPAGFESALGMAKVEEPSWRWSGDPPLEVQLDHVTLDPKKFDVVRAEVRKEGRSDHFPIVAWLRERGGA